MKTILALATVAMVSLAGLAQSLEELVSQADAAFQEVWTSEYTLEAHDTLKAKLEEAISLYEQALAIKPEDSHVLLMLARSYYTLADVFLTEENEKKQAYLKGRDYGFAALNLCQDVAELRPETKEALFLEAVAACDSVAACYWLYANWARYDEFDKFGALKRGDAPKLHALIERALELDDMYLCAGPYRSMGGFWGGLPSGILALFMGRWKQDLEKAEEYLSQAVKLCPEYLENLRFMVEYCLDPEGEEEEAQELVDRILAAPIGDYPLYNSRTKLWARKRGAG